MTAPPWLEIRRGKAPLLVSLPHTGTDIPDEIEKRLTSSWLARKDADWWIDRLYDFALDFEATVIRTRVSRTVIDVNRDPEGASLYPGQATTDLCPVTTFDGEPLYRPGEEPQAEEIKSRRAQFYDPYHAALTEEIRRLKGEYPRVVLYDCHSIRSRIPRLFDGELPVLNLGTNKGRSCDPALERLVTDACSGSAFTSVVNGRFTGGAITRRFGKPGEGVHALQMELACRGYMDEPVDIGEGNWPSPYDATRAQALKSFLLHVVVSVLAWAGTSNRT